MGFLSSSLSLTRYRVLGEVQEPVLETIYRALQKHRIIDIDNEAEETATGWTSLAYPYQPNFDGRSFVYGPYLIFSLRIDRKSISPRVVKKHLDQEMFRKLTETGSHFLSRNEKKAVRDQVIHMLSLKVPATPNIYDLLWNMENHELWFFSTLKSANEELETLFQRSFQLQLIQLFPFSIADLACGLSDSQKDELKNAQPTRFME